jgi:hypothetical protein
LILRLKRIAAAVREDVAAGASAPGGRL